MKPSSQILYPDSQIDTMQANKMVYGEGFLPRLGGPEVNKNVIWRKELSVLKINYLSNHGRVAFSNRWGDFMYHMPCTSLTYCTVGVTKMMYSEEPIGRWIRKNLIAFEQIIHSLEQINFMSAKSATRIILTSITNIAQVAQEKIKISMGIKTSLI